MVRLQHVVIFVKDPVEAAKFYERLGMTKIIDGEDLYGPVVGFSDGHVNWTLMPAIEGRTEGIDHVGFLVDDVAATREALETAGAVQREGVINLTAEQAAEAGLPLGSAQVTLVDPAGVNVELGSSPWPH